MDEQIQFEAIDLSAKSIEDKFMNELAKGNGGIARRVALAMLNKSSDELYKLSLDEETSEAFLENIEAITNYLSLMESHIEMVRSGQARIFAMLQFHFEDATAQ